MNYELQIVNWNINLGTTTIISTSSTTRYVVFQFMGI